MVTESTLEDEQQDRAIDNLNEDFCSIHLVLYDGQCCTYGFSMIPPNSATFTIFPKETTNLPPSIPKAAQSIENSLNRQQYENLIQFCSRNNGVKYNFQMECYVSSNRVQSIVSFFNGLACCTNGTNVGLLKTNKNTKTGVEYSALNVEEFKVPAHTLVLGLSNCIRYLLDPPRLVIGVDQDADTSGELTSPPMMLLPSETTDNYDIDIVSRARFSNSYPLHLFTYIAYLGGFILKTDFQNNCAIGYQTYNDLYQVMYRLYNNALLQKVG